MAPDINVTSHAFREGGEIPAKYTCQGQDVSPELAWSRPPAGTRSLVLIMDDPDAPGGGFTHWVLFNIPAMSTTLREAVPQSPELPDGSRQARNDFGQTGYGGPCPPPGRPHHYRFTIYALDTSLELAAGASAKQVAISMGGHVLAQGRLVGTYRR